MYPLIVFYGCRDLSATAKFYKSLGLISYNRQPGVEIFDTGYGYLGFVQQEDFCLPRYSCISFNCADQKAVDAVYDRLNPLYDCTKPQRHPRYAVYSFFLADPDGYRVEFQYILPC